jgi:hypothetical protein
LKGESLVKLGANKTHQAEYLILQATVGGSKVKNIGILLFDPETNKLHCRYRRDFKEFAGDEADVFQMLPQHIEEKTEKLGAAKCLEWMESKFSNAVLISRRKSILVSDFHQTLGELYGEHIQPEVLQFRTHLPQYSIQAAAGKYGKQMEAEPEGWVEVISDMPLNEDMFVTHVTGHSMEPRIPDASLCAFQAKVEGSWDNRILLIEHYGESGGNRYTVKLVHVSANGDPHQEGEADWLHQPVTLESLNPEYPSWSVPSAGKIKALGEFLFVVDPITIAAHSQNKEELG